MKLSNFKIPREHGDCAKNAEIPSESSICPLCSIKIRWINDVPIELNSTVHLGVYNMGRF